jgi:hypothetical protein
MLVIRLFLGLVQCVLLLDSNIRKPLVGNKDLVIGNVLDMIEAT